VEINLYWRWYSWKKIKCNSKLWFSQSSITSLWWGRI